MATHSEPRTSIYRPLDPNAKEIRVLVVHGGEAGSRLNCSLCHVSLANTARATYETVSYVWGGSALKATIRVDGRETEVTTNAEEVLRRFRYTDRDRALWIDAVCINQMDVNERSQQVAMMQDIYSDTAHGLVWLGADLGLALRAKQSIDLIVKQFGVGARGVRQLYFQNYAGTIPALAPKVGNEEPVAQWPSVIPEDLDYDALIWLFLRPWFTRIWVAQEAALPRSSTFYCGNVELELLAVLRAASWLRFHYRWLPISDQVQFAMVLGNADAICDFADREHGIFGQDWDHERKVWLQRTYTSIMSLQDNFGSFKATDPRDLVFGLQGLWLAKSWAKVLPRSVLPDYTKSIKEVFISATRFAIAESNSLAWMRGISHRPCDFQRVSECLADLPTWSLQLHSSHNPEWDPSLGRPFYKCSGTRELGLLQSLNDDETILSVLGTTIGVVEGVSETLRRGDVPDSLTLSRKLNNFVDTFTAGRQELWNAHSEVLFAAILSAGHDEAGRLRDQQWTLQGFRALLKFLRAGQPVPAVRTSVSLNTPQDEIEMASRYKDAIGINCTNRRFFTTKYPSSGLGPQTMEPGDVVAILYTCTEPMVLRRLVIDAHYTLIGPAYLPGCMFGERAPQQADSAGTDEVFHIH